MLELANYSKKEYLVEQMSEATEKYKNCILLGNNSNLEYSAIEYWSQLVLMKRIIDEIGIEGVKKKIREKEFSDNLFLTNNN